jgi:hypothetical protein
VKATRSSTHVDLAHGPKPKKHPSDLSGPGLFGAKWEAQTLLVCLYFQDLGSEFIM